MNRVLGIPPQHRLLHRPRLDLARAAAHLDDQLCRDHAAARFGRPCRDREFGDLGLQPTQIRAVAIDQRPRGFFIQFCLVPLARAQAAPLSRDIRLHRITRHDRADLFDHLVKFPRPPSLGPKHQRRLIIWSLHIPLDQRPIRVLHKRLGVVNNHQLVPAHQPERPALIQNIRRLVLLTIKQKHIHPAERGREFVFEIRSVLGPQKRLFPLQQSHPAARIKRNAGGFLGRG